MNFPSYVGSVIGGAAGDYGEPQCGRAIESRVGKAWENVRPCFAGALLHQTFN